jgi:hypothetical protein
MTLKDEVSSRSGGQEAPGRSHCVTGWLWPVVIDLWIGAVLVLFLVIRVLGSNMARHALRVLWSH